MQPLAKVDTPNVGSIEQVSKLLKCSPTQMIKTLIYVADGQPAAVLVRGDHEANEGKVRRALGATSLALADPATITQVTGAPVGFAGPVGLNCRIIADHDIPLIANAVTGANAADAHYTGVNVGRDYQLSETFDLRDAAPNDPCPRCTGTLQSVHGIEVGHVFKLGTKYSTSLNANFLDEKEQRHPMIMGCYGIGVTRVLAANQGLYNGFLAAGLLWGLSLGAAGFSVKIFFLLCVAIAGLYGAATAARKILYIQTLPAAVGIALLALA